MWDYIIYLLPWASAFWIAMLIDCLVNPSVKQQSKFWWLLFIFWTHGFGAFIYLIFGPSYLLGLLMRFLGKSTGFLQNQYTQQQQHIKQKRPQPKTYYVPTQDYSPPTYEYDQGYQAQNTLISEGREPKHYSEDYEQPQTSYPEMPQQQSM